MTYKEILRPSFGGFFAISLIGPASWLVASPIAPEFAGFIAALILGLSFALILIAAPRIEVAEGLLKAGRIRVPLDRLGEVEVLCGNERRLSMGVQLDSRAQLCTSPWVDCILKIRVLDDVDPVPYIVLSTRRPELLKKTLHQPR